MTLRLLSGGVDSLYLSVRGGARTALLAELEAAKVRAEHEAEPVPFEFGRSGWRMLLKPGGYGGYAYWLTSPEVELWLGRGKKGSGPAARVQLHSLYLHGAGARAALAAVRGLLEQEVCAGPPMLGVSRLDVYADVQGWRLEPGDLDRFASRANHREAKVVGRRFTGFVFGTRRGGMLARLYDKEAQMEEKGLTWMREVWRGRDESERVWRLEFELRRGFMRRLEAQEPAAVLDRVAALWRYCTVEWLTLRTMSEHAVSARWPLDPVWVEVPGLLGEVQEGRELVWQESDAASELRVLTVYMGTLTSWAAMAGIYELERAAVAMAGRGERFLAGRDRTFATEVARKRARLEARGVRWDGLDGGRGGRLRPSGRRPRKQAGAKPRVEPEGSKSNRIERRRGDDRGGAGTRRWRVRDGGGGGGYGRQPITQAGRGHVREPGDPKPRRGHGSGPSVSFTTSDGTGDP